MNTIDWRAAAKALVSTKGVQITRERTREVEDREKVGTAMLPPARWLQLQCLV